MRQLYDRIMRLLDSNLYVTFDIARSRGSYWIASHKDNRYKWMVGLICFNNVEDLGGEGGE